MKSRLQYGEYKMSPSRPLSDPQKLALFEEFAKVVEPMSKENLKGYFLIFNLKEWIQQQIDGLSLDK